MQAPTPFRLYAVRELVKNYRLFILKTNVMMKKMKFLKVQKQGRIYDDLILSCN